MSGVTVGSDAFFPFGDSVERAGSPACSTSPSPAAPSVATRSSPPPANFGMVMAFTGIRLFHH